MRREPLLARLLDEMELSEDSLRVYRLREPRERHTRVFGQQPRYDLHDPLVLSGREPSAIAGPPRGSRIDAARPGIRER